MKMSVVDYMYLAKNTTRSRFILITDTLPYVQPKVD